MIKHNLPMGPPPGGYPLSKEELEQAKKELDKVFKCGKKIVGGRRAPDVYGPGSIPESVKENRRKSSIAQLKKAVDEYIKRLNEDRLNAVKAFDAWIQEMRKSFAADSKRSLSEKSS